MSLGMGELLVILVIILLLFGPGKLPKVMESIGQGIKSLKKGIKDEAETSKKDDNKVN